MTYWIVVSARHDQLQMTISGSGLPIVLIRI